MTTPITQDMIEALVMGTLDDDTAARVEAYLNENPDAADMIDTVFEEDSAIIENIPTPPPLVIASPAPANTNRAPWRAIAASVVMLGIGVSGGWFARQSTETTPEVFAALVSEAVQAHSIYSVDPHRAVELSDEEVLVRWLSNRVGAQLSAPDLTAHGFTMIGGRLLSVTEGPAAQFMYEDEQGRRITLFAVRPTTPSTVMASFEFEEIDGENSFRWEDETLRYAVIGDLDRQDLSKIASAVYQHLS